MATLEPSIQAIKLVVWSLEAHFLYGVAPSFLDHLFNTLEQIEGLVLLFENVGLLTVDGIYASDKFF
jgi:hypothetical protein